MTIADAIEECLRRASNPMLLEELVRRTRRRVKTFGTAVEHTLAKLVAAGKVVVTGETDDGDPVYMWWSSVLGTIQERIIDTLNERGPLTLTALSEHADVRQTSLSATLPALLRGGKIEKTGCRYRALVRYSFLRWELDEERSA